MSLKYEKGLNKVRTVLEFYLSSLLIYTASKSFRSVTIKLVFKYIEKCLTIVLEKNTHLNTHNYIISNPVKFPDCRANRKDTCSSFKQELKLFLEVFLFLGDMTRFFCLCLFFV